MKLLIPAIFLLIVGCKDASVIEKAQQYTVCENRGGVHEHASRGFLVRCRNAEYVEWRGVIVPEKYWPKESE